MLILSVTTEFAEVEVHGLERPRWYAASRALPTARLSIQSTSYPVIIGGAFEIEILESEIDITGPAFFEETIYRIRVKSHVPKINPILIHRDPLLFQDVDSYDSDFMLAGSFSFKRQVGRSAIEVRVGNKSIALTIEVFPAKIDYKTDYEELLSDISGASRALAFEYLRATFRGGQSLEVSNRTTLDWLLLLRNEISTLETAFRYIEAHPHRTLQRQIKPTQLTKIKRVDSQIIKSVRQGRGSGRHINIQGIGPVRSIIPAVVAHENLNNPEHQWLRINLLTVRDRLSVIMLSLTEEEARQRNSERQISARLQAEKVEVVSFIETITSMLSSSVLAEVSGRPSAGFASLTLLSAPGYSDAYRSLMVLRLGLSVTGGPVDLSVMDIHELYETWCFIAILRIILETVSSSVELSSLLKIDHQGIRVLLRKGSKSQVKITSSTCSVAVIYNQPFAGLTGVQKPDIVLRISRQNWPDLIIVLDAKYRIDSSDEYRRTFGITGPPVDAINALHRYRDAITIPDQSEGRVRPVVRGAALFPLSTDQSEGFANSRLSEALEVLGIGALPFTPSNTALVKDWIKEIFSTAPNDLALPGPTFSGLRFLKEN